MIPENKYYSYNLKELPKGCQFCVRGEKLVLFVTGLCPRNCFYCPLSDNKYSQDVSFANERKVSSSEEVLLEAELMNAKGAGITGGDPLSKLDRTLTYIKKLKDKFGPEFHIHLYTSLNLVTESALQKLYQAGLDEIRFHLDLNSPNFWKRIDLAKRFPWDIGIEVPLIPSKESELKQMVDFIQNKVQFLNLNELEKADNSFSNLNQYATKDKLSYAIKDSLELGLRLLNYIQEKKYPLNMHLCTAKLKDSVQLANRFKREAPQIKKEFDLMDEEGLLTRGALYLPELTPSFSYRKILAETNKPEFVKKLNPLFQKIKQDLKLNDNDLFLDPEKPRILLSSKNAKKHKDYFIKLNLNVAIVKEYPTADQLEIEINFLN